MKIALIYILIVLILSLIKKVDAFDAFFKGTKETFKSLPNLFINIFMIALSINVFIKSGIVDFVLDLFKIEDENKLIIMQMIFKPISWSSSLLVMNNIIELYGVDSKFGILSSVIQSSCDTCFYITMLYLSHVKISKNSYTILASILSVFLTFLFCVFLIDFFRIF